MPSLRNAFLTGPWGHDGFFNSLEAIVRHHLNPLESLNDADPAQCVLPSRVDLDAGDFLAFNDPAVTLAIGQAIEIGIPQLSDGEIGLIMDFLQALTDPSAQDLRHIVPRRVPSGLPLAEIN